MQKILFIVIVAPLIIFLSGLLIKNFQKQNVLGDSIGAPPYGEALEDVPLDPFAKYRNWKRPEGPAKVGLQVGHLNNKDLPDELEKLRNNTGSSGGGKWEWEVNLAIANATKELLEKEGIQVDILPATVPAEYWADVFVAIHADGSLDRSTTGYKAAAPWRDFTGNAGELVTFIEQSYQQATKLTKDDNITRNMRGYYAFAWWRYEHSIHPQTTAAILETGFLTNINDRNVIVQKPHLAAAGIAEGIIKYLDTKELL